MISSLPYPTQRQSTLKTDTESHGLSRVFAAAVVNRQFCQLLLEEPDTALQKGYLGETFSLSPQERDLILTIRADSLPDFAQKINMALRNHY